MKILLVRILLPIFLLAGHITSQAQDRSYSSKERLQNIQNAKIAFITEKLNLTIEQSQRFWPIYNQYDTERNNMREKSRLVRLDNIESISDAEVRTVLNSQFDWRQREVNLDKEYMNKFLRVISARQLAQLYCSEWEFTRMLLKKLDHSHHDRGNK